MGTDWSATIDVSESEIADLRGESDYLMERAMESIVARFREGCIREAKKSGYIATDPGDVDFNLLKLEQIDVEVESEACCDDDNCIMCDTGYHERCRNGCTIGRFGYRRMRFVG